MPETYQQRPWNLPRIMDMRFAPLLLVGLLLTGCSSTTVAEPEPAPESDCIEVSEGVAAALASGITDTEVTLDSFAAVPSPETDGVWYVAAHWDDGTLDGDATWATTQDPTGDDAAFLSVDEVAETISMYNRLDGGTAAAPGAIAATACLK